MIRKYHNHKLQTTPWHREEEPLNPHETPGRQIKQSNQLCLWRLRQNEFQTSLLSYRDKLENWNFICGKFTYDTFQK